jgi:hypothetical protein
MMHIKFNRLAALLLAIVVASASCADNSDNNGGDPDAGPNDTVEQDAELDASTDAEQDADDTPADIGEPCRRPDACVSGAACVGNESGEQFRCMRICDEAGRVCDDGSICTARLNAPPVCYTLGDVPEGGTCTVNLECTPGSLCFGSEPDQYCIRGCHPLDDACDDGEFCDANDQKGPCRSIVGADCDATADCRDDLICTTAQADPLGSAFPDGYCTATGCSSDDDCPYESVCRTPPGTETAICMQTCETESDCRFNQGYTCLGPTDCGETNDRQACGDFVGSQRLCVPDAFKTAF